MDIHVHLRLMTALRKYDERRAKKKDYNRFAFGHYCRGLTLVEQEVAAGASLPEALRANFTGSLLACLEKAAGLPVTK